MPYVPFAVRRIHAACATSAQANIEFPRSMTQARDAIRFYYLLKSRVTRDILEFACAEQPAATREKECSWSRSIENAASSSSLGWSRIPACAPFRNYTVHGSFTCISNHPQSSDSDGNASLPHFQIHGGWSWLASSQSNLHVITKEMRELMERHAAIMRSYGLSYQAKSKITSSEAESQNTASGFRIEP